MRKNKGIVLMAIVAMVAFLLASCDNSQKNPIDAIDLHGAPFDRSYIQEDYMNGGYWLALPEENKSFDFESRNQESGYTYEYVKENENGNQRWVLRVPYGEDYWIYEVYTRYSSSTDWDYVDPIIKQKLSVTHLCEDNDSMAYCYATKDQKYGIAYIITDSEDIMEGTSETGKTDMDATMVGWVFPFMYDKPVEFMTDAYIYRVDNENPPFPGEPNMLNGSYNEEYDNWLDKHSKYPSKISMIGAIMNGATTELV